MAIKAVLDTNIWISAIIKGKMADLLGIAVSYEVTLTKFMEKLKQNLN